MEVNRGFIVAVFALLVPGQAMATSSMELLTSSNVQLGGDTTGILAWTKVTNGILPENAFLGGKDVDGDTLYVCRGYNEIRSKPGVAPGKFKLNKGGNNTGKAYISWGGGEQVTNNFQILTVSNPNMLTWTNASNGAIPAFAVEGGPDENNEMLYIGRFSVGNGTNIVGKIAVSHKSCYIALDGKEVRSYEYQVLTLVLNDWQAEDDMDLSASSNSFPFYSY